MTSKKIGRLAVFVLAALIPSVAMAKPIRTMSASYGTLADGKTCDATAVVANICDGRARCDVKIGNDTLCQDPNFLVVKQAQIIFMCGRYRHKLIADEYTVGHLDCN